MWVLDTNVILDWLIFRDPQIELLRSWIETDRARLATRADCRMELVRVLAYPRLRACAEERRAALAAYDRYAIDWQQLVPPDPDRTRVSLPLCRDPDDQKFLELARDAGAHWLISKDKLVLKLARRMRPLGLFRIVHPAGARAVLAERDGLATPSGLSEAVSSASGPPRVS